MIPRAPQRATWSFFLASTLAAAAALHAHPCSAQRIDQERIELEVGEQRTISAANVANYSPGPGGYVDVRMTQDGRNFVIVGLRAGTTSLLLIYSDNRQLRYTIVVEDPNQQETVSGIQARENIRLDLYFVELSSEYSHALGLAFPTSFALTSLNVNLNGDFAGGGIFGGASPVVDASVSATPLPRLDLGQSSGWARISRQAMLVTANGQQATIDTGGDVNVVVSGGFGGTLQKVHFGTQMSITPRFDASTRRVEITVDSTVADLTPAPAGGVPGVTSTHVTTLVNLEIGEAIVLGGSNSAATRENQSGLVGLSQIPILGVLFGTNARGEQATENVVMIVPTVVEPITRTDSDRISEAMRIYARYGNIGGPGLGDIELIEPLPPGYRPEAQ